MAFNVENLFDAKDDPGKSDETYLPANKKKAKAHITKCKQITVRRWREQCLYWDWNEVVVEKNYALLATPLSKSMMVSVQTLLPSRK